VHRVDATGGWTLNAPIAAARSARNDRLAVAHGATQTTVIPVSRAKVDRLARDM
jgi:hypothetical protein